MDENIKKLNTKFINICNMGWVKGKSKGSKNIGYTFELLLGKQIENFEIPDYEGIEIKTQRIFTRSYITLFNATPDGTYLFEIKRIRNTYGYPDSKLKNIKVFNISIFANEKKKLGSKYLFKLIVDRNKQKIYLCVFNVQGVLIDNQTFWTFQLLEEKVLRKLKVLAIVDALYSKHNDEEFFKFNSISFYKLKNFDSFIDLVEQGIIGVTFKIGVFRSDKRYGEIHDRGTGFVIKRTDIEKMYEIISI